MTHDLVKRLALATTVAISLAGPGLGCKKASESAGGKSDGTGKAAPTSGAAASGGTAPTGSAGPAPAAVQVSGRRLDVTVTKQGYAPSSVEVAANEQVTLVFTRTETTECGSEIVIPSLAVKKALPLNEPVAIAFKTDKPGEVAFTCGMDMMKGAIVVK
jgi:plastocyanin